MRKCTRIIKTTQELSRITMIEGFVFYLRCIMPMLIKNVFKN